MSAPTRTPVAAARELADRVLRPQAERADVEGVRREVVDEIGRAGLLGLAGPKGYGGAAAPAVVQREVQELLAGADGATWFVTVQHHSPVTTLGRSDNVSAKERWLHGLCTGELLAGVAIAQLRRPGAPAVAATRVGGGWRLDGRVGWATSWGLADLVMIAAVTPGREVVMAFVPAREGPGLSAGPVMDLAVMAGTRTVALQLDGLVVPDEDVAEVALLAEWLEADRLRTANVVPGVVGLLHELVTRLAETAEARGDSTAATLAARLAEEGEQVRSAAYALIDHVPPPDQVADRLALRAQAGELTVRAATGLIAATGGGAMARTAAPQRLMREAMFYLVQAQTGPVREATLLRLLDGTS